MMIGIIPIRAADTRTIARVTAAMIGMTAAPLCHRILGMIVIVPTKMDTPVVGTDTALPDGSIMIAMTPIDVAIEMTIPGLAILTVIVIVIVMNTTDVAMVVEEGIREMDTATVVLVLSPNRTMHCTMPRCEPLV